MTASLSLGFSKIIQETEAKCLLCPLLCPFGALAGCAGSTAIGSGLRKLDEYDLGVFLTSFQDNFVPVWGNVEVMDVEVGRELR